MSERPPDESRELSPDEYRFVFEAAPDGILVVDEDGRIRDLNPRVEELFGYEREELLGSEVERLVPERARAEHREMRHEYEESPHRRPMGIGMRLTGRTRDGTEVPVEISLSPLQRGDRTWVIAVVRDVTERIRLRRFGARTLQAAEDERRRLARELHDDTAQRLATVLLRLRLAEGADDEEERTAILSGIRDEIHATMEGIRRIARGLRPPALEDAGLVTAIRSHVRGTSEASAVDVRFETEGDPAELDAHLSPDERLIVYRVIQEALSNVVRHSGSDDAVVLLASEDGRMQVVVEDRGTGFDPGAIRDRGEGLGLVGMEERVSAVGGTLEIDSEQGRGTRVVAEIPVRNSSRQEVTS